MILGRVSHCAEMEISNRSSLTVGKTPNDPGNFFFLGDILCICYLYSWLVSRVSGRVHVVRSPSNEARIVTESTHLAHNFSCFRISFTTIIIRKGPNRTRAWAELRYEDEKRASCSDLKDQSNSQSSSSDHQSSHMVSLEVRNK